MEDTGEIGRISGQVDRNSEAISQMRIEQAVAAVRFDLFAANTPDDETLEKLEAKIMASVSQLVTNANAHQSRDILGEVRNLFDAYRTAQKDEQLASQRALLEAIQQRRSRWLWWVLGIVGGLIVSVGSVLFGIWIAGLLDHQA